MDAPCQIYLPNNPVRVAASFLKRMADMFPPGSWISEDKEDGWRRTAYKSPGSDWFWQAKSEGRQAVVPVPSDLAAEFKELFSDLDDVAIDMEWIGPRNQDAIRERYGPGYHGLRLLDLICLNGSWLGKMTCSGRLSALTTLYELCRAKRPHAAGRIQVVRAWDHDWDKMFEENKRNPMVEGIVLKKADSPLVLRGDNPFWYKVKYRDIHEATRF